MVDVNMDNECLLQGTQRDGFSRQGQQGREENHQAGPQHLEMGRGGWAGRHTVLGVGGHIKTIL